MIRQTRLLAAFSVVLACASVASATSGDEGLDQDDAMHVMWPQPPVEIDPNLDADPVLWGWDEPARSTEQAGQRRQWRMDADDFRCLGAIPVTGIRWWGGYKAWGSAQPPGMPQPTAWHIGFWANMAEGLEPNDLYPERLVWSVEIPSERVESQAVGLDRVPGRPREMCFVYEAGLESEQWFHPDAFPTNEGVFWISITAIYPADAEAVNMWGWRTRPHLWGRGAVTPAIMGQWPAPEERLFPGRIYPIENSAMCGARRACDLCFELLIGESWAPCDQPFTGLRDWPWYVGEMSEALELEDGELLMLRQVAADWVCERQGPVIAASWQGSYLGYAYEACGGEGGAEPRRPDYFLLYLQGNAPPNETEPYEHPGETVWEYAAFDYDEVLVGFGLNPEGEPNEAIFRYSVRFPEEAWFRQTSPDAAYWFSVVPVFTEPVGDRTYHWGWTNRPHDSGGGALFTDYRLRMMPQWQPAHDPQGQEVDMSFQFLTVPPSSGNAGAVAADQRTTTYRAGE